MRGLFQVENGRYYISLIGLFDPDHKSEPQKPANSLLTAKPKSANKHSKQNCK